MTSPVTSSKGWWATTPPTVRRVLVSVVLGAAAFIVSTVSNSRQSLTLQLTLALLVSGITVVVQFLGDVERQLADLQATNQGRSDKTDQLVERRFAEVNAVTKLFAALDASAIEGDIVRQFVGHATSIGGSGPKIVQDFACREIGRMSQFLKELEDGDATYDGEDRDWLLSLTSSAEQTIDATSLTTVDAGGGSFDGGFWTTDLGRRYLETQQQAMVRGVIVRRLFVLDRPELIRDSVLLDICSLQISLGIDVRVLDPASVSPTKKSSIFDFVVFDGAVSYEVTPASIVEAGNRPAILKTELTLFSPRVKERADKFNDLWQVATPVS